VQFQITLQRNPKATRAKTFVAEIDAVQGNIRFVKPVKGTWGNGVVKGLYELEEGKYYLMRRDESSHKNARIIYEVVVPKGGKLETVAKVIYGNGSKDFETKKEWETKLQRHLYNTPTITGLVNFVTEISEPLSREEEIAEELRKIMERYGVGKEELMEILKGMGK